MLDGEGGYTVYGRLMPASDSLRIGGLPLGLAHKMKLKRALAEGAPVRWEDVEYDATNDAVRFRREMERTFAQPDC
jgi:predicted homoserine dehydrogenase-like protein